MGLFLFFEMVFLVGRGLWCFAEQVWSWSREFGKNAWEDKASFALQALKLLAKAVEASEDKALLGFASAEAFSEGIKSFGGQSLSLEFGRNAEAFGEKWYCFGGQGWSLEFGK